MEQHAQSPSTSPSGRTLGGDIKDQLGWGLAVLLLMTLINVVFRHIGPAIMGPLSGERDPQQTSIVVSMMLLVGMIVRLREAKPSHGWLKLYVGVVLLGLTSLASYAIDFYMP